ncbi:nose resistant to fluoxetine protein 6-like [Belonocnema kinseyi]|uniref:nose resistant to fluoxetine protein 6-like n=1 Tax=Belonocnema kinseyi TaxID=2817044 RepID=UPI00143CC850|nr:nose resistant to fluoxetine protein 6-like [Belonocnema kinseyi]
MYRVMGPEELLLTFFNETSGELIFNEACKTDILAYKSGLDKKEIWALRMLDASSKIPTGLLIGNFIEMGMYDECMEVHVNKSGSVIRGNHCTYVLHLSYKNKTLPVNPLLSICLPVSCQEKDLSNIVHKRMVDTGSYQAYNVTSIEVHCSDVHVRDTTGAIITGTIVSALFLLLLIFTIIALLKEKKILKSNVLQAVCELSLYKNIRSILSLNDNTNSISALHGLRAISTTAVIIGHGFLTRAMNLHANNIEVSQFPLYLNIVLALAMYAVDTFLTISGFLVSYSFLKKHTLTKGKLNFGILTPTIAAAVLASIYFIPFFGSGPKWRKISKDMAADVCKKKWWTILLYINNIVYKDINCMLHLWSTAVDMQLFWISPIILYPLVKKPKLGLFVLSLLIAASIAIPVVVIATNNYPFSYKTNLRNSNSQEGPDFLHPNNLHLAIPRNNDANVAGFCSLWGA